MVVWDAITKESDPNGSREEHRESEELKRGQRSPGGGWQDSSGWAGTGRPGLTMRESDFSLTEREGTAEVWRGGRGMIMFTFRDQPSRERTNWKQEWTQRHPLGDHWDDGTWAGRQKWGGKSRLPEMFKEGLKRLIARPPGWLTSPSHKGQCLRVAVPITAAGGSTKSWQFPRLLMNPEVLHCNVALSGLISASGAYRCDLVLPSRSRFFKYFKNIIPNLWKMTT